jgi:hypothetical protein
VLALAVSLGVLAAVGPNAGATNYIGSTITLSSSGEGNYAATLVKVIDPAVASSNSLPPNSGTRFVGVEFTVKSESGDNLDVTLANEAVAADAANNSFDTQVAASVNDCNDLQAFVTLAPNSSVTGCVVFQVPNGDHLTKVYVGSGGQAPATWTLAAPPPPPPARFSSSIKSIRATSTTTLTYVLVVSNGGGLSGTPTCKTTFSGPKSKYEYSDTEKLSSIKPGETLTETISGVRLSDPEAKLLVVKSSSVTCK